LLLSRRIIEVVPLTESEERISQRVAELLREPTPDRWLDTKQAAEYLSMHPDTLSRLYRQGRIPGTQERPNAKVYYRLSDLEKYRSGGFHPASNGSGTGR
jgi:hypothetical protein